MKAVTVRDAERYVGLTYRKGEFDCASLAVLVQRELFGRRIKLPAADARSQDWRGQAREVEGQQLAQPVAEPFTGCAALFWQTMPAAKPPHNRLWHIGTVFLQNGLVWVLHGANETHGVVLKQIGDIQRGGLHFGGFYRWN